MKTKIVMVARWLIGVVFIVAAVMKIGSPQPFADSLAGFHLLPGAAVNIFALSLPWFELACGFMLITGILLRTGLAGVVVMLTLFCVALANALLRGLSVDCGCFGAHSWLNASPGISLLRDGVLLAFALLVYASQLSHSAKPVRAHT